ncbi:putative S-adenosyl-L-methionine-dependent methyltransferase [Mycobacterium antarcticum]|uniref:class I SAM-dependent methyltransferase n=1 Tax=unclassified Mycolicibacterium TaxID=2636767 RepID=UPI00238AE93B|nr:MULTISPECIES: class I SAM-dependent methyltransferase [unclassified Mycolicibacterium]BDX34758.1 putative S-adenosyl-L-methionine-dependent methyltransferase [Mycolicibacterium sp. TUM20985]GLP77960.1 putative S-adenosyl-L-methionine-dependent methyltransferase [Mycolicibacterium sp. TUM20983]GLP81638.1 putative S-adenosyl-L-methionine-dependent methyltransferase [Mycolicibacterium sp. TUM20984]
MRTERDTWDITTSVGSTALFVAAARALEAQKPEPLAADPYAEIFCRAVGGEWADMLDGKASGSRGRQLLETEFGGHFVSFQGARTKYFDTYFAAAAAAGVRQVVILAAGLDSRAYRLPWPDATVIFELDQPTVLDFKRDVLAEFGDAPRADRREVAVDLRDDWPKALADSGFDAAVPTAWIAEGLLIYLPAEAQEQLFAGIDALSSPGSWAAVEEGRPMPRQVFEAKKQEERDAGEAGTFFTLVYNEQIAPADEWFGARGWTATPTPLAGYLADVGRPVPPDDPDAGPMAAANSLVRAVKG